MAQHPTNKPTILYQPLLAQVLWLNSMRGKKLNVYHATHKQTNTYLIFETQMPRWICGLDDHMTCMIHCEDVVGRYEKGMWGNNSKPYHKAWNYDRFGCYVTSLVG